MINIKSKIFNLKKRFQQEDSIVHGISHTLLSKGFVIASSFIFTPVLSRLFDPVAYGHMSVFSRFSALFLIIGSFGYADAILVSKNKNEFHLLFFLSGLVILFTSSFFLFFGGEILSSYTGLDYDFGFVVLVWAGILATSYSNLFAKSIFENKAFVEGSKITIYFASANRIFGVVIGFFAHGFKYGLIIAESVARLIQVILYERKFRVVSYINLKFLNLSALKIIMIKYKRYPFHYVPSRVLNSLFYIFIIYEISNKFDMNSLGQFAIVSSLINMPVNLLGNSLAPVIMRYSKDRTTTDSQTIGSKVYSYLFYLLFPVLIMGYFFDRLLPLFLGSEWQLSGEIARYMIVGLLPILLSTSFSGFILLRKKEPLLLIIEFLKLLGMWIYYLRAQFTFEELIITITLLELMTGLIKTQLALSGNKNLFKSIFIFLVSIIYLLFLIY